MGRKLMKNLTGLMVLLALMMISATNASAQIYCERHFYNNSNVTWIAGNAPLDQVVPPHTVAPLNYISIGPQSIRIRSPFYDQTFPVTFCYLNHDGNTGYVVLNDPARGDVQTCGNPGYPCPGSLRVRKKRHH
jgi:hypothetical protein